MPDKANWFRMPMPQRQRIKSNAFIYVWADLTLRDHIVTSVNAIALDTEFNVITDEWIWQSYSTTMGAVRAMKRLCPQAKIVTTRQRVGYIISTPMCNYAYEYGHVNKE